MSHSDLTNDICINGFIDQNTSINDFHLGRVIGKGTFGKVRICQHKSTGRIVVLKLVQKHKITSQSTYDLLQNERITLQSINSPFAVDFYGTFTDSSNVYFVQEYISGGELFRLLQSRRKFTLQDTRFIAAEVVSAFTHFHSQSIVYRDLKPENILITSSGHLKLVDFGFATMLKEGEKCNMFCGTLEYLAPEMIFRNGHDFSVDWWTLGVLIYELLIGFTPFTSKNSNSLVDKILKKRPEFPARFDEDAKDLICKLLEKDPKVRIKGEEVKKHQFFKDLDWAAVSKLEIQPFWRPCIRSDMDTSNYEFYEDSPANSNCNTQFNFEGF